MPEGGRNPKATLDQVTNAKHPNEALEKRKRDLVVRHHKFWKRKSQSFYRRFSF